MSAPPPPPPRWMPRGPRPPGVAAMFTASEPEVVVTHNDRMRAGLHHWVDGTMGIARRPDRTVVLAPNGQHSARHDLSQGGFVAGLLATEQPLTNPVESTDHASGGPLLVDPTNGSLLLVYHAERFTNFDPADYWAFLGMARSDDDGATFTDLGPVLTSDVREDDPDRSRPIEIGPGSIAVRDGWVHLYAVDRGLRGSRINLLVARCAVDDLWAAVRAGRAPIFHKYFEGAFSEPGLGGRATDLLPMDEPHVLWFDVAVIEALNVTVLVHATVTGFRAGRPQWTHVVRTSPDGVQWSPPQFLHPNTTDDEMIYVTIDSGGDDQRIITTNAFDLYVVRATTPYRWDSAHLERVRIRWSSDTA